MITLYLAWQDQRSHQWFPVGRLDADEDAPPGTYEFSYVSGAKEARESAHFLPILGFPELTERYYSSELFPLFRSRVMNLRRPDRPDYLRQLGLDTAGWDMIAELSVSGGNSRSDSFEVFPAIEPDADGWFQTRFILHGLHHTNPDAIRRTASLEVGEWLFLSFELCNPDAVHAITVTTHDKYILGWLPRYLVDGLHQDNAWMVTDVKANVAQVNLDAPLGHRLLVDFSGKLPVGFRPMDDLPQYQPIVRSD